MTTTPTVKIHSHRGEDGANVLAVVGPGATVRRAGYQRHWLITATSGQLVSLIAKNGHPDQRRAMTMAHADDLTLIRQPGQLGGHQ